MIQYNTKDWFGLIFKFHKSDTFRRLFWVILSISVYTGLVVYIELDVIKYSPSATPVMHQLLGLVISLLLVFRTNTAYDRWWEGRKQWGALVNVSRNLAIKTHVHLPPSGEREMAEQFLLYFAPTLKRHLRNVTTDQLNQKLPQAFHAEPGGHVPNNLCHAAQRALADANRKFALDPSVYLAMLNDLNIFTEICGACERIKNTPIPYTYNIFIKKFIFVYILTMPFAFVGQFGYWSVLITAFTFYTLASLELIAETIEDPFGKDTDDLPTDQLTETIERNLRTIFARDGANK